MQRTEGLVRIEVGIFHHRRTPVYLLALLRREAQCDPHRRARDKEADHDSCRELAEGNARESSRRCVCAAVRGEPTAQAIHWSLTEQRVESRGDRGASLP